MRNLAQVSKVEQSQFLNSFDDVLCDVDGVIWGLKEKITGSDLAVEFLKRCGKKVKFVSNNSTRSTNYYLNQLEKFGMSLNKDDLITPVIAIIDYLKLIQFDKEIFMIGSSWMKAEFKNAGFKIMDDPPSQIEETVPSLLQHLQDNPKIGAVIVDVDINLNFLKLQKANIFLKRPEVLFIAGAIDAKLPFGDNNLLIGPKYFCGILEEFCGRKALQISKPSRHLWEFLEKKFHFDRNRVLFIGDSISEDMGFAVTCGFKKLLVLSGLTKKCHLDNWDWPDNYKPDFYLNSLADICNCFD